MSMRRTVKQLAKVSGVSVRTLHHYHAIGLLVPAEVGTNGYRWYGQAELLRLQQILFFRELGFELAAIASVLDDAAFDLRTALLAHRAQFEERLGQLHRLIRTIDHTVATLDEDKTVSNDKALFDGFDAEKQAAYEAEIKAKYGEHGERGVEHAQRTMATWGDDDKANFLGELREIERGLADAMVAGDAMDSLRVEALIARHRDWVGRSWPRPPDAAAYAGLADMYTGHPDFVARYEAIRPGFADWLADAMRSFAHTRLT
ncbi:MerR family transcriptional regulator [Lysobacter sp. TY2-98]|uniref:MerR family transcriptional regulator n=1 Tax=Lysobacter sp. TY2-98 TaxID=2290922 RepID=UPI000E20B617|nr:MerR family transcriptional regulator [Lysobacter sp. TY2-98]AXK72725.1 MerR family transcriptional regulator [Lysobacter sp. TY2-98]